MVGEGEKDSRGVCFIMIELYGKKVVHFVFTRFNLDYRNRIAKWSKDNTVYLTQRGGSFGTPDEWLRHRVELFRKYCYPSVVGQSNRNFIWLLTCDPETPTEFTDILSKFRSEDVIFRGLFGEERCAEDIIRSIADGVDILITSRVDNDDALHVNYVEQLQTRLLKEFLIVDANPWLINMRKGYVLDTLKNKLYAREMHNCPFHSMFQWYKEGVPLYRLMDHSTLHLKHTTKQDDTLGWLQVIHDRNTCNHVQSGDKEIPMSALKGQFILEKRT